MANFSGKTALITGASAGIGKDLADIFAEHGHHLVLVARNRAQLLEIADKLSRTHGINATVIDKDLSIPNAAAEIFNECSAKNLNIDYLVNNAGFGTHGPLADADVKSQTDMVQVNITALVDLTRLFLPPMLTRGSGKILNVASTAAFQPGPLMATYYASKAFVLSFSEAIDDEVSSRGVTVTALCPGPTTTEFQKRAGIESSPLFRGYTMTSRAVAEIGYNAMMRGKRTVICGFKNRFLAFLTRFLPRKWTAAVAHKLNQNR